MFIFTRKIGERFLLGKDVVITILGFHENQVRIGIDAPKEAAIRIEDLHLALKEEKKAATLPSRDVVIPFAWKPKH